MIGLLQKRPIPSHQLKGAGCRDVVKEGMMISSPLISISYEQIMNAIFNVAK